MLAYVFWHLAADGVDRTRYEDALVAFHRALAERPSRGFLRSRVFRLDAVPWLDGGPGYEDRYLLEGSSALDPLNEAAVAAGMRVPHDAVARLAEDGAGGLYRRTDADGGDVERTDGGADIREGRADARGADSGAGTAVSGGDRGAGAASGRPSTAVWLTKPRDASYADFTAEMKAAVPEAHEIWWRQMVLGPAPEFCVVGREGELRSRSFPDEWRPIAVRRHELASG